VSNDDTTSVGDCEVNFVNPARFLAVGMSATVLPLIGTLLYSSVAQEPLVGTGKAVGLIVVFFGCVVGGLAVMCRPRSSVILGLAALQAYLASIAFGGWGWDSAALLLKVLAVVSVVASLLVLIPRALRLAVVSVFIVLHFGGILSTVCSAPPGTWVAGQLWATVYHRYLEFMYLNNAYHFYAPEPGPASLFWFLVEYERNLDGSKNWRWVKVPELDRDTGKPLRPDGTRLWPYVEYTRRLSLVENGSQPDMNDPTINRQEALQRRVTAGNFRGIPLLPDMPAEAQYRPISSLSRQWLSSYVRYVARSYPCREKPELQVTGVKVYRVIHNLLMPVPMIEGVRPWEETSYLPFYFGDFDKDGNPKPYEELVSADNDQQVKSTDPFLYWLIPIMRAPGSAGGHGHDGELKNFVYVHANVDDRKELP
jgi:hypothetical protein